MMDRPLSPQDLEILSAYLDNQLEEGEVKRLEARLTESAGLRTTLEDLRRTRLMLRSLPKVRAPRNFTLSPRVAAEIRRPRRSFWQLGSSWSMVSAVAVMLLMVTLMGDLMGVFTPTPYGTGGDASGAVSLAIEMEAMEETAPMVALAAPETPPPDSEAAAAETFAVAEADTLTPGGELTPEANARMIEETPAAKEMSMPAESTEDPLAMTAPAPPAPLFTPPWVRVIEVILLVLAAAGAAAALALRRSF